MHRAHKFMEETREEALALMGKGLRTLNPKELDLIVALCDAHSGACEIIEIEEKLDGKGAYGEAGSLFSDNPRRRR